MTWDILLFIAAGSAYILITYLVIKLFRSRTISLNPFLRLSILALLVAVFWGVGLVTDMCNAAPGPWIVMFVSDCWSHRNLDLNMVLLAFWWVIFCAIFMTNFLWLRKSETTIVVDPNDSSL
jgi:hypothetical protein